MHSAGTDGVATDTLHDKVDSNGMGHADNSAPAYSIGEAPLDPDHARNGGDSTLYFPLPRSVKRPGTGFQGVWLLEQDSNL